MSAIVLFGAAGIAAATPRSSDPKAMVLQKRDLQGSFGAVLARYITNAQLAATTAPEKNLRKLGRISGYYVAYTRTAAAGLTVVESFASVYEHNNGARDSLQESVAQTRSGGQSLVSDRSALASLGSDAKLLHLRTNQNGTKLDYYTVAWRNNRVFAEVRGAGRSGTIDPADVIALAKRQDARIAKLID